jgi:hypothetical protein
VPARSIGLMTRPPAPDIVGPPSGSAGDMPTVPGGAGLPRKSNWSWGSAMSVPSVRRRSSEGLLAADPGSPPGRRARGPSGSPGRTNAARVPRTGRRTTPEVDPRDPGRPAP